MSQTLTVNLHNPQIQDVHIQSNGSIVVELGNGVYHGGVDVFFEDRYALDDFLRDLRVKVEGLPVSQEDVMEIAYGHIAGQKVFAAVNMNGGTDPGVVAL